MLPYDPAKFTPGFRERLAGPDGDDYSRGLADQMVHLGTVLPGTRAWSVHSSMPIVGLRDASAETWSLCYFHGNEPYATLSLDGREVARLAMRDGVPMPSADSDAALDSLLSMVWNLDPAAIEAIIRDGQQMPGVSQ